MKSKILVLLLVCICFLPFSVICAEGAELTETTTAEENTEEDGCNTKEELHSFLKSNEGGTITLTADILWDYSYSGMSDITNPTVVEMGTYKISIPAECMMQIQGPVTFRGEGAVLFETDGLLNLSCGAQVLSTGESAVAVQGTPTSDLQLFMCNISAKGANSVGIQSEKSVTVQLCHVSGAKAAIEAPEITLDASSVSPELTEATVIERVPTLDRSLRFYGITLPVDVSQEQYKEAIYGYGDLQYAFIDPETGNAIGSPLECDWSEIPPWPAKAGSYLLTVKPSNLPDWFPVEIPSFDIPLHIVDSSTLWLTVGYADPCFGMLALELAPNTPAETAQVTLFCSTDKGQTWNNVTEVFPDSTVRADFIDVAGLEQNTNYWFYAQVTDGSHTESSNIIYHPNFVNVMDVDFSHGGGDRDEDDFGDQGEKPPFGEIISPPDTGSSADSTTTASPADTTNNITHQTTTVCPSETTSAPVAETTAKAATDLTTRPTQQTEISKPDISENTEITKGADKADSKSSSTQQTENSEPDAPANAETEKDTDESHSTSHTENNYSSATDETSTQPQDDEASSHTLRFILIILTLAVVGGIVCVLLLWRKGGRR